MKMRTLSNMGCLKTSGKLLIGSSQAPRLTIAEHSCIKAEVRLSFTIVLVHLQVPRF